MEFATYCIIQVGKFWRVLVGGRDIGVFQDRETAEAVAVQAIEARCREGQASQLITQDGLECSQMLCPCFDGPALGTSKN